MRTLGFAAGLLAVMLTAAATTTLHAEYHHTVGVEALYVAADSPLESGWGPGVFYRYLLVPDSKLQVGGGVAFFKLDREPEGLAQAGELQVIDLQVGVAWGFFESGPWKIGLEGGLDFFITDADGTYSVAQPIGIQNEMESDNGVGAHGSVEFSLDFAQRWQAFASLGYLFGDVDGTQRYVISGVKGNPTNIDFNLTGPRATLGVAVRF